MGGARQKLGPWSRAQINVSVVFVLAAPLWMLPGAVALVSSPHAPLPRFFEAHLPESVVALGAAILLFALPTDLGRGEFTIGWRQAARVDWGAVLLFGGGGGAGGGGVGAGGGGGSGGGGG